jgi:hypothetical protein
MGGILTWLFKWQQHFDNNASRSPPATGQIHKNGAADGQQFNDFVKVAMRLVPDVNIGAPNARFTAVGFDNHHLMK